MAVAERVQARAGLRSDAVAVAAQQPVAEGAEVLTPEDGFRAG